MRLFLKIHVWVLMSWGGRHTGGIVPAGESQAPSPFVRSHVTQAFALFALAICAPEKDGAEGIVSIVTSWFGRGAHEVEQWIGLSVSYSLLATAFVQLYLVGQSYYH